MARWRDIPLNKKLFKNVDEAALTNSYAALQNCFVTEAGGLSRFPGLKPFCVVGGNAPIYLDKLNNDLIAVGGDGRTYRIDRTGNSTQIPGTPVLGGRRVIFARTKSSLAMAAGQQIIECDGKKNEALSKDAPLSTHVGWIDNYLLAVEANSGRFQHSKVNEMRTWDALDTFAADGRPDNINAMLITPFNEILMTGEDSIEQFERYVGGDVPFFRRWSVGDGVIEPYTLCHADNAAWGINGKYEFSRFSGQTSSSASDDIGMNLEHIYKENNLEALNRAWAVPVNVKGQKFIILQIPDAINDYGGKGVTFCYDLRQNFWCELTGWDDVNQVPAIWPGVSVFQLWGKVFVGGRGKIYELTDTIHNNDGKIQRMYGRTAHFDDLGPSRIDRVRLVCKRGVGSYTSSPKIAMRVNPDNKGFGRYQMKELGLTGQGDFIIEFGAQGMANTWQFEFMITDDCPVELRRLQVDATAVAR